jgi:hypothetical protein
MILEKEARVGGFAWYRSRHNLSPSWWPGYYVMHGQIRIVVYVLDFLINPPSIRIGPVHVVRQASKIQFGVFRGLW